MANDPRLTDHPTAGWVLVGTDGAIVSADERFGALVATDPDALTGRRFDALVAAADAPRWADARAAGRSGRAWRGMLALGAGGVQRTVVVEQLEAGTATERLTVIRAEPVGELVRSRTDTEAELAAFHAVQAISDLASAARAVLQAVRGPLPFDWALVARFDRETPGQARSTTVVTTYPGAMAGIGEGSHWTPLTATEQTIAESASPVLSGDLLAAGDDGSPLSRLVTLGMRSRLQIPLFANGHVAGTVALYSADADAFQPGDGLRLERLMLPFQGRLQPAAAGARESAAGAPRATPPSGAIDTGAVTASVPGPAERDRWAPTQPPRRAVIEERLGALGEMVSGVAHELNNPLTAILGYAQILPTLEGFDRDQALKTIEQEALRASRIVRNLLAFARQHRATLQPVNVEAILRRVIDARQYSLRADHVTIETSFTGVRPVMADEFQLEQVFLNLLNNAHQAMQDDGGTVTVATEQLDSTVRIHFRDTGPGVPEEIADRIFEPFFTTRDIGTGVGLGLAIVYGLVAEHQGHVWVESVPGSGADFIVDLPASPMAAAGDDEDEPVVPETDARVLVVDDELPIRALTSEILSGMGFRVGTAATVDEATRLLDTEPFDALIIDMALPGIDPVSFDSDVSGRWPRLHGRLLWITDEPESDRAVTRSGGAHLEKPFDTQMLLDALRAILAVRA